MFRHNPQGLEFGTTYRTDSASGSDTPVTVYTSDGTLNPIAPTVGASGSTMQEHDPRGGDTVFYASQATVYLKPVNYYNGTPTGSGVITSTGSAAVVVTPLGGLDPASLPGTYAMQTGGVRKFTGPTLPTLTTGTRYVWEKTDTTTGDLIDIVTGVAP